MSQRLSPRPTGILLVISGALTAVVLLARLFLPPLLDFVLLPIAHLLMAGGAAGLSVLAVRARPVGIAVGAVWGAGWLMMFLSEALMLLWILPPGWLRASPLLIVLGGLVAGVLALLLHRGSSLAGAGVPGWTVLAFATLSPLFLWLGIGLAELLPAIPASTIYAIRSGEEVVLAVATLAMGVLLLVRSRRADPFRRAEAA